MFYIYRFKNKLNVELEESIFSRATNFLFKLKSSIFVVIASEIVKKKPLYQKRILSSDEYLTS